MFSPNHETPYSPLGIISNNQQYMDLQSRRRIAYIKAIWVLEQTRRPKSFLNKNPSKRTPR